VQPLIGGVDPVPRIPSLRCGSPSKYSSLICGVRAILPLFAIEQGKYNYENF